jgi:hypothetical protein
MNGFRLNRRAVLRGAGGILVGLPALEAMQPRSARAATAAPKRLVIFYTPNGTNAPFSPYTPEFWPKDTGITSARQGKRRRSSAAHRL